MGEGPLTSRNQEEDTIGQETNDLHSATTVELVVNEEGGEVVSDELDEDVDQVPEPGGGDVTARVGRDDLDERRLEELVSVEQEVVEEPVGSGTEETASEVAGNELEILDIVSGLVDVVVPLGSLKGARRVDLLVVTVVSEPEGHGGHNGERDSVSPLGGNGGVRGKTTVVEDQQKDDEDNLVEKLTPTCRVSQAHSSRQ